MRLTIQRRLFLATFLLAVAMTVLLLFLVRWNLEQGFVRYAASAEMARLGWLADRLERAYAEHGNWDFLRGDAAAWRRLCRPPAVGRQGPGDEPLVDDPPRRSEAGQPRGPRFSSGERADAADAVGPARPDDFMPRRDEPREEQAGPAPRDREPATAQDERPGRSGDVRLPRSSVRQRPNEPPPNDPLDMGPRLGLLDDTGRRVAGNGTRDPAASRAIVVGGKSVGRLTLQASATATSALDRAFLASQMHNLLLSGLLALVLSVFAAWVLSRGLLRPVRDLAGGAREIAQGRLEARIPVRQDDELGALASDFNDMAARLARADEARRAWLADASHELRTPLAVLQAEIEAMQDGVRPADPQSLASLHRQVLKLTKLVADLRLTLDRREVAKDMLVESVDPVAELAEVIEEFRPRFAEAEIALETTNLLSAQETKHRGSGTAAPGSARGEFRLVRGDPDRLRQVFMNLLENSLRYTHRGGRLRVTRSLAKGWMTLQFDDTEPAPSRSALPHLFERFYRAEPSRSRAHGGSGLGLSICKAVVEAHGGRIGACPSELGGLCVRVELPLEGAKR